jgi:hypothetical protein
MTDFAILGKKVLKNYPFMANELIAIPDVFELELIPCFYDEYNSIQADPENKHEVIRHRIIFIAAIVKLYDPDYYDGYKKNMKNGLRKQLSDTLNCKPSTISDSYKTVKDYMSIYPDYNDEVAYIYSELKKYAINGNPQRRKELPGS